MPTTADGLTKEQAQQRADRIRLFREELAALQRDGVSALTDDQRRTVASYHDALLEQFAGRFDVDRTEAQRRMSLGMQVASLVGALAFSAAVFMFFFRFWGSLGTGSQLAILVVAPILAVAGVEVAARREKSLYFASILGLVALACFVLDISMVGAIFNMQDSPNAALLWAAFAFALAYAYNLPWLLFAGIVTAGSFVVMETTHLAGLAFGDFMVRPEPIMVSGAAALAMAAFEYRRGAPVFGGTYRFLGWVGLLFPILLLTQMDMSYLPLAHGIVGPAYMLLGFGLGALAVWMGIRQQSNLVTTTGVTFLSLLLFVKLFDWWWDWMPRYLFFFLLGVMAVGILVVLRRLRLRIRKV